MIRLGLIPQPRLAHEWVLGANSQIERGTALVADGNWKPYLPQQILQRNNLNQDYYICVTASALNIIETLIKQQYGIDIVFSRRFTAKMSGTIPGVGNSVSNIWDSITRDGLVLESDYPTTPGMSISEYFAPVPAGPIQKGKDSLNVWQINHEWLPDDSYLSITSGLKWSPIQASVCGSYLTNADGLIIRASQEDNHEIAIDEDVPAKFAMDIFDSESLTNELFTRDYGFHSCKIASVKKKFPMKLYKLKNTPTQNNPTVYFLNPKDNLLVPYTDGSISGGDMFKIYFGDYKLAPIQHVDVLPYPVASYAMTTAPVTGALAAVIPDDDSTGDITPDNQS